LVIDKNASILGVSVAEQLSYFEDETAAFSPQEFLAKKSTLKGVRMTSRLQNFDFTKSSFFIHFTLDNQSGRDQTLILETARPLTNRVNLYSVNDKTTVYSGDGIPFELKSFPTNFSALSVFVPAGKKREYVLHLTSDGDNLTAPMVFFDRKYYVSMDSDRQLFMGVFLGVLLFVIIIYSAFFVLLKERLFLVYVLYATSSGLLQFSLDGYMHEFVFRSGGYFAQHAVPFIAIPTLLLGMFYSYHYLVLTGVLKKITSVIVVTGLVILVLSLIPGPLYEFAYILINGFSLLVLLFMMAAGLIQRRKSRDKVSILFLTGFAFLVLGGLVFILGNFGVIDSPLVTLNALKIGTMIEMIFLSILMAGRYKELQQEREFAQQRLLLELEEKNRIASGTNERLEFEVEERTRKIEAQRLELKGQNEDFMSSVIYAKRIQKAVLSNREKFTNLLPDSFEFFQPKDVVSGDFYWIDSLFSEGEQDVNHLAYVTADCTGHGVPGALVSLIGNHLLESVKTGDGFMNPGVALDTLSKGMNTALNSRYASQQIRDGMDLTLCVLDKKARILHFSGAKNSAYIIRKGELIELKGDRKSIGFAPNEESHSFQTQTLELEVGDMIYTCSDGYADQFGGPKGKKFMLKQLKKLFIEISSLPMDEQNKRLKVRLEEWMGDDQQLDDILILGVRIVE
jgi:serine phosphatase RsbU (regulator of sigma subunit)